MWTCSLVNRQDSIANGAVSTMHWFDILDFREGWQCELTDDEYWDVISNWKGAENGVVAVVASIIMIQSTMDWSSGDDGFCLLWCSGGIVMMMMIGVFLSLCDLI